MSSAVRYVVTAAYKGDSSDHYTALHKQQANSVIKGYCRISGLKGSRGPFRHFYGNLYNKTRADQASGGTGLMTNGLLDLCLPEMDAKAGTSAAQQAYNIRKRQQHFVRHLIKAKLAMRVGRRVCATLSLGRRVIQSASARGKTAEVSATNSPCRWLLDASQPIRRGGDCLVPGQCKPNSRRGKAQKPMVRDSQGRFQKPLAQVIPLSEAQRSCDADDRAASGSSFVLNQKKLEQDPQGPEPQGIADPPPIATAKAEEVCKVADATVADAPSTKINSRLMDDFAAMAANLVAHRHAQGWVSADEPAPPNCPNPPQNTKSQQDSQKTLALMPSPQKRAVTKKAAISFRDVHDANRTWNLKLTAWKVAEAGFSYCTLVDAVAKVLHTGKRGRNIEGRIMIVACKLRDERGERCGLKPSGP